MHLKQLLTDLWHEQTMDRDHLERSAERRDVALEARCRTFAGLRDKATLVDISMSGCCIICRGLSLEVGSRIIVQPAGLEGIAAVVRWTERSRVGVEFDKPLYPPIFEHLSRDLASRSSVHVL